MKSKVVKIYIAIGENKFEINDYFVNEQDKNEWINKLESKALSEYYKQHINIT